MKKRKRKKGLQIDVEIYISYSADRPGRKKRGRRKRKKKRLTHPNHFPLFSPFDPVSRVRSRGGIPLYVRESSISIPLSLLFPPTVRYMSMEYERRGEERGPRPLFPSRGQKQRMSGPSQKRRRRREKEASQGSSLCKRVLARSAWKRTVKENCKIIV